MRLMMIFVFLTFPAFSSASKQEYQRYGREILQNPELHKIVGSFKLDEEVDGVKELKSKVGAFNPDIDNEDALAAQARGQSEINAPVKTILRGSSTFDQEVEDYVPQFNYDQGFYASCKSDDSGVEDVLQDQEHKCEQGVGMGEQYCYGDLIVSVRWEDKVRTYNLTFDAGEMGHVYKLKSEGERKFVGDTGITWFATELYKQDNYFRLNIDEIKKMILGQIRTGAITLKLEDIERELRSDKLTRYQRFEHYIETDGLEYIIPKLAHIIPQEHITFSGFRAWGDYVRESKEYVEGSFSKNTSTTIRDHFPKFFKIDVKTSERKPLVSEHWSNDCAALRTMADDGQCFIADQKCIGGEQTKTINGLSVTRPCWRYMYTYNCQGDATDTCKPWREKGCVKTSQKCVSYYKGACNKYEKTYKCFKDRLKGRHISMTCGGAKPFCSEGDCSDQSYKPNSMFTKIMSMFLGFSEGKTDKADYPSHIFAGRSTKCRKSSLRFKNCCGFSGLGNELGVVRCSEEEKELKRKRNQKKCHYIGFYERREVLGAAATAITAGMRGNTISAALGGAKTLTGMAKPARYEVYCCWDNVLDRIINVEGRKQLASKGINISWGTPEHPRCRGLTVEEIQLLDMTKFDFKDAFEDLLTRTKSVTLQEMETYVKDSITGAVDGRGFKNGVNQAIGVR